jgi:hypothetical protein
MTTFQEIKTYEAFCHLVDETWRDVQQKKTVRVKTLLSPIVDGFLQQIEAKKDDCSPEEAESWCAVLERPIFAALVNRTSLLQCFVQRIREGLKTSEAGLWLRFMDGRKPKDKAWLKKCTDSIDSPAVPDSIACKGMESLANVATPYALSIYHILCTLELPQGQEKWHIPSFRKACWSCLTDEPKEIQDIEIRQFLRQTLEYTKPHVGTFNRWVEVFCSLRRERVVVEGQVYGGQA